MINDPLINTGTQKGVQSSTYKYLTEKCLGKFLKNYNVLNHIVTDTKRLYLFYYNKPKTNSPEENSKKIFYEFIMDTG